MRVGVDLASVIWTALRTGKSKEGFEVEHEGRTVWVNPASSGYEFATNSINGALRQFNCVPRDLVLVNEGLNSKRRRVAIDPNYKLSRGTKAPAELEQYQMLRQQLLDLYGNLGAIAVSQEGVEGDDVLGWLAENMEEDFGVLTFDNDLMVLQGVNKYGAKVDVRIKGEVGVNKYGDFPFPMITLYKALVGDSSDNIKGCPGFGPAKFAELYGRYGEDGMFDLMKMVGELNLKPLDALHGKDKLITLLLDNQKEVFKSWKLAKLHPEWVDTMNSALEWKPGMVKGSCEDERLKRFNQRTILVTTDNLVERYQFLQSKLAETPDFPIDIESSPVDESREWMAAQGRPDGVDVLGHRLTGFSVTFGSNHQYTYYVAVNHRDTKNISLQDARFVFELLFSTGKPIVIQNTSFEGVVLATEEDSGKTWMEHWKDNGYRGFIPNWLDTVFEASYVDENEKLGLKERSKMHLGYEQRTLMDTVCKTGKLGELPVGGEIIKVLEWEEGAAVDEAGVPLLDDEGNPQVEQYPLIVTKQYMMKELTGEEVVDYGCDDTICTSALHNFYKLIMQLEHTWKVYLEVEIDASYQHVKNFLDGMAFSLERMQELAKEDDETYEEAWAVIRGYLIANGWDGTTPPVYTKDITAKQIKEAYAIWHKVEQVDDEEDDEAADGPVKDKPKNPVISSRVRTPAKFLPILEAAEADSMFVRLLRGCLDSDEGAAQFTKEVCERFDGEPRFTVSPKQMQRLMYEVMGLPVKVYNKPTAAARKRGERRGTAKTDALAIKYALLDCSEELTKVLKSLQLYQMVKTRRGLYYEPYPYFIHWKTGRIHGSHRQCATNTRRASEAGPNKQQLPKHPKLEGQEAKFRECIRPHKPGAVIVSVDESQQELRLMAYLSRDDNLLSCYTGPIELERDVHSLTGIRILSKQKPQIGMLEYAEYRRQLKDEATEHHKLVKKSRNTAKPVNFGDQYGAMAAKIAQLLLIEEAEAQTYLDAKDETFPKVNPWKRQQMESTKESGLAYTLMGARRHLRKLLNSDDYSVKSKADRQGISFMIQGSGAEMLKLAEGRMWKAGLSYNYDAVCYGPIHDEVVWSVDLNDLTSFLKDCHACMVAPYGGMDVNIVSEISFGPNFFEQIELGPFPTDEAINRGLEKYKKMVQQ